MGPRISLRIMGIVLDITVKSLSLIFGYIADRLTIRIRKCAIWRCGSVRVGHVPTFLFIFYSEWISLTSGDWAG